MGFLANPLSTTTLSLPHNSSDEKLIIPRAISLPWWQMRRASLRKNLRPATGWTTNFQIGNFEGLKNLRPRFPPDISGGSYSRSKFATEIRCSSSRRLNIHTFYILICIEICIRFVIKKFCKCEITKCWGFLKLWYCQLLRSLSYFEMFSNYLTDRVWSKKMI